MPINKDSLARIPIDTVNIADQLSKKEQEKLGKQVVDDYNLDLKSRTDWNKRRKDWLKLFMQKTNPKDFPWPKASNVPIPILTTAVIQFQARAYEALMPAKQKIKIAKTGFEDSLKAERVAKHMNFQVDYLMEDFEEGWDISLFNLPINGSIFRKTYFDPILGHNVSKYCSVEEIIVNYETDPSAVPRRISHILYMVPNDLAIREQRGIFININKLNQEGGKKPDTGSADTINLSQTEIRAEADRIEGWQRRVDDPEFPRTVVEQHRWWDMDGDGIDEPYVVTVDVESMEVLRVTKRMTPTGLILDYFTHYYFFPNPEGFYGLGFGHILESINAAASSILNQIIDAGTLQNLSGKTGFINKRSGIKKGDFQLGLGDYKAVDINSDDIRKAIFSFKFEGPSQVLFATLGLLQEYSTRVTTVSEALTGELPKSDTPATAIVSAIEQGMKVFSTIHKRIHRMFKKELKKLYILNSVYPNQEQYELILGDAMLAQHQQLTQGEISVVQDYSGFIDVVPVSDPNITSRAERMAIAEQVKIGVLENPNTRDNPQAIGAAYQNFYKALGIEDIESINPPPPPPLDLPQVEENAMFLKEQGVEALQHHNHEEHLQDMEAFEQSPHFENLSPRGSNLFEVHRQQHFSFLYLNEQQGEEGGTQDGEQTGIQGVA